MTNRMWKKRGRQHRDTGVSRWRGKQCTKRDVIAGSSVDFKRKKTYTEVNPTRDLGTLVKGNYCKRGEETNNRSGDGLDGLRVAENWESDRTVKCKKLRK